MNYSFSESKKILKFYHKNSNFSPPETLTSFCVVLRNLLLFEKLGYLSLYAPIMLDCFHNYHLLSEFQFGLCTLFYYLLSNGMCEATMLAVTTQRETIACSLCRQVHKFKTLVTLSSFTPSRCTVMNEYGASSFLFILLTPISHQHTPHIMSFFFVVSF